MALNAFLLLKAAQAADKIGGNRMKRIAAVILAIGMMLSATSCNMIIKEGEEQFDYPVTIGNLVLEEAPQNIAVLSENIADVVITCGLDGKLAARSDSCTQEALSILPSVGTPDSPDIGGLQQLGVDLVLADCSLNDETTERLETLGIHSLIIKPANDITSLGKLYNNVAAAAAGGYNGKMQAMSSFEALRGSLDTIKANTSESNIVATTCYIYDLGEDECVVAYGNDFANQLFDYASLTNIAAADDDGVIGIDTLLKGNPDSIFCDKGVYEKLVENKDLKSLKALTGGTVYELPRKYLGLQGSTCVQTTDFIAAKTHKNYDQTQSWPEEFSEKKTEKPYVAPFEPKKGIFYTVGENYEPIKAIEERLIGLGYMDGSADTSFTAETAEAISAFQSANSLTVTGIADYETLTVLLSSKAISKSDSEEVSVTID